MAYYLINKKRKTGDSHYDELTFGSGANEIHFYGSRIFDSRTSKKRIYIIELHIYDGFSMIKFYPKVCRNNPKKFELRGQDIGFHISKPNVIKLLVCCATIMKLYLDENPECFSGYIGQTDARDDRPNKRRGISQRSSIYNPLTNTIFPYPRYKLSSKKLFSEVNLRLIRKVISKQEGKLTKTQMKNYQLFLDHFESQKEFHLSMMTALTRSRYDSTTSSH